MFVIAFAGTIYAKSQMPGQGQGVPMADGNWMNYGNDNFGFEDYQGLSSQDQRLLD